MGRLYRSLNGFEKLVFACGIILLAISLYLHFLCAGTGDKVWLIYATRLLFSGKKLYVDVFEVNPPLIYWLYLVPEFLSAHFPLLKDAQFLTLGGFAIVAAVVFVSLKIIRFHPEFADDVKMQAEFCLLLLTVFLSFTTPASAFDREHLFLMLVFPYVIRWLPSLSQQKLPLALSIAIGVLGGVGFCIKPHCAIVFLWIQIMRLCMRRSLTVLVCPENLIICAMASCYLVAIWALTPEYLTIVIPMALATYGVIRRGIESIWFAVTALLTFIVTFPDFRLRYTSPYRKDIFYLLALCPAYLGYVLLNNGWGYTWNPLTSFLLVLTGFVLWEFLYLMKTAEAEGRTGLPFLHGARACLSVFAVWFCIFSAILGGALIHGPAEQDKLIGKLLQMNEVKHFKTFGTLSIKSSFWAHFSEESGAQWVTRFNHVWMLPKFFVADAEFVRRYKWIPAYVAEAYAEDLRRNKPDIVFVDDEKRFFSVRKHIDLVAYLSTFPAFREEWKHYRCVTEILADDEGEPSKDHKGVYVYRRID